MTTHSLVAFSACLLLLVLAVSKVAFLPFTNTNINTSNLIFLYASLLEPGSLLAGLPEKI
jgi:hypothetical protein